MNFGEKAMNGGIFSMKKIFSPDHQKTKASRVRKHNLPLFMKKDIAKLFLPASYL